MNMFGLSDKIVSSWSEAANQLTSVIVLHCNIIDI